MLLENIEHGLNLRPHGEEKVLPPCHDLFLLLRMRRSDDDRAIAFPDNTSHNPCSVVSITYSNTSMFIESLDHDLCIVDIGRRESNTREPSFWVNACMQLKAVVPPLVIFPKGCNAFRHFMGVDPDEFA